MRMRRIREFCTDWANSHPAFLLHSSIVPFASGLLFMFFRHTRLPGLITLILLVFLSFVPVVLDLEFKLQYYAPVQLHIR